MVDVVTTKLRKLVPLFVELESGFGGFSVTEAVVNNS